MAKMFENKIVANNKFNKLGLIEKRLRMCSNLTIEQAASYLNISKGYLSEIENGKRILKEETFFKFIHHFYPDFDLSWSIVEETENQLDQLFYALAYWNSKQEDDVEKWMVENRGYLLNSFACIYLAVLETYFSYRRSLNRDDVDTINSSEDFVQYLSPDIRALLLFNKGYMYMKSRIPTAPEKSAQAIRIFETALKEMDGKRWPQLEGIIKANLATAVAKDISFQQAFKIAEQAKSIFIEEGNFLRMAAIYNNQAVYLNNIGQYERAIEIIDKLLLNKSVFKDEKVYRLAVMNKILSLIEWGHFNEALQFIHDHKSEMDPKCPDNFTLEPYCLLRAGKEKACLAAIKLYQNSSLGEEDEVFYALIKAVISENFNRVEKAKAKMFSVCCRMKNWGMMLVMLQALAYFYKQTHQSDRLIEIYEWQAMLHNHQMPSICEM